MNFEKVQQHSCIRPDVCDSEQQDNPIIRRSCDSTVISRADENTEEYKNTEDWTLHWHRNIPLYSQDNKPV